MFFGNFSGYNNALLLIELRSIMFHGNRQKGEQMGGIQKARRDKGSFTFRKVLGNGIGLASGLNNHPLPPSPLGGAVPPPFLFRSFYCF